MKKYFSILLLLLLIIVMSCDNTKDTLGEHKSVWIKVDPSENTPQLNTNDYSVDSICPLSFPDNISLNNVSKFIVKNDRIYILDTEAAHTVFVFDTSGKYLFKLGERGRAKHEYTYAPTDFFVDNMGNTHVFDQMGQKILSFTKYGKIFRVVITREILPHSFGLTNNNKYAYCRRPNEKENPVLMFSDWNKENQETILYFNGDYTFVPSDRTFFSNSYRLSHIPILSDSVLVFNNDSLEKVVHFDFGGKFVTEEIPDAVTDINNKDVLRYKGVLSLNEYQETDDLVYMEYVFDWWVKRWLLNKKSKKTINAKGLFEGINPFYLFYLRDNQIITLVDHNIINAIKEMYSDNEIKNELPKSVPQVKDIFEGKIEVPVLLYISVK